jgi:hypothetical protein
MADIRTTTTNYVHPTDPNLLNIHKAMQFNSTGQPVVRVHVDGISLEGDVIVDTVSLSSSTLAALETITISNTSFAITNFPTTSTVYQGTSPWVTTITNWPALQYVNGVLYAVQSGTWNVGVTGSVSVNNSVTITNTSFAITNFPTTSTVYQGTNPWTVTGTIVASNFTSTVNVANTVTVNQGTNPWTVTGNINATIDGEVSIAGANPDAFGRARVSELFTLGDYKHIYALDPNFLDSTSTGGTVTFYADQACARLATSSSTSSYAIHQTKFYHHYQPGKSQLIYDSVNFYAPHRNVTKRTGYFDANDGIYFEQVGSDTADGTTVSTTTQTLNWVIRSYVGGSANEANYSTTVNGIPYTYKRRVPQSEWNIDPCDGTGPSGFKLDITKTQLVWIDFQWLGVGRVRCGFVHNGALITAHEYYHSNVLPTVYISNPNLPVRCEIRNTGVTSGGVMDQICSTVMSEGGYVESGIDWSVYSNARATPTPGQTRFPLLAIRLKNSFNGYPNRLSIRPSSLSLFAKTEPIVYEVVKLPSAASLSTTAPGGLIWTSADVNSGVEYCVNATAFTAANVDCFASGYVPSGSSQNSLSPVATGSLTASKKNIIGQNIDSTDSEVFVVIVSTIFAGNQLTADVACAIQWREIY